MGGEKKKAKIFSSYQKKKKRKATEVVITQNKKKMKCKIIHNYFIRNTLSLNRIKSIKIVMYAYIPVSRKVHVGYNLAYLVLELEDAPPLLEAAPKRRPGDDVAGEALEFGPHVHLPTQRHFTVTSCCSKKLLPSLDQFVAACGKRR